MGSLMAINAVIGEAIAGGSSVRGGQVGVKHGRGVDSASEEKFDTNVAGTLKAPSRQPSAQIDVSCIFAKTQQLTPSTSVLDSKLAAPSQVLETIEQTRRQKVERGSTFPDGGHVCHRPL